MINISHSVQQITMIGVELLTAKNSIPSSYSILIRNNSTTALTLTWPQKSLINAGWCCRWYFVFIQHGLTNQRREKRYAHCKIVYIDGLNGSREIYTTIVSDSRQRRWWVVSSWQWNNNKVGSWKQPFIFFHLTFCKMFKYVATPLKYTFENAIYSRDRKIGEKSGSITPKFHQLIIPTVSEFSILCS